MKFLATAGLIGCLFFTNWQVLAKQPVHAHAPQSKETWRSIRTNNLFLVGNAGEEDLRQVAVWLEFFHSAFGQLTSRLTLDSSVPTTVIVFKDDASFLPFKPLYQGKPANVAGYFQSGQDMNYIAMSMERGEAGDRGPFSTAFHEYVHLHLLSNFSGVPLWLNEGLAEFYGSISHANGEAVLGATFPHYVRLLRSSEQLLPLSTLFSVGADSAHYNEQDKSGLFYAQSWALVHYLMMGGNVGRQQQFKHFLNLLSSGDSTAKAIEDAFGVNLETLEREFREYVRGGVFPSQRVRGVAGAQTYIAMQRTSVSEGEANFYLGDLLLHIHREEDAEKYFKRAISLDPGFAPTYASLGLLCVRQNRYEEARKYLQRAVASPQSYLIHYLYAYLLSREGLTPRRSITGYSPDSAQVMREQLRIAIKLAPEFSDPYYLLAFVHLVSDKDLNEAVSLVQRAQKLEPSKLGYGLLLAQIYMRQREVQSARQILEPLARQNTNPSVRSDAQSLLDLLDGTGSEGAGKVGNSIAEELAVPPASTSGTIVGGSISGGAIRDGKTIENSGTMPALTEIIGGYLQAVGGEKALATMRSRVAKGTVDVVGVSRGGSVEVYTKAPNKTVTVIRAHPFGVVKLGFNGVVEWRAGPKGASVSAVNFYDPARLRVNYPKMKLLGKSKIGFRDVYVLELQPSERLYLEVNTYLPVRANVQSFEIYLDDWREVDGIKLPFSISQSSPGLTVSISLKEFQHNVALQDALFEK